MHTAKKCTFCSTIDCIDRTRVIIIIISNQRIDRWLFSSDCSFLDKAIEAERAGALAVLITDSADATDAFIEMIVDDDRQHSAVSIPTAYLPGQSGYNHYLRRCNLMIVFVDEYYVNIYSMHRVMNRFSLQFRSIWHSHCLIRCANRHGNCGKCCYDMWWSMHSKLKLAQ